MTLSKPEFSNSGDIFSFWWRDEALRARVDRLTERSSGELVGEITIESELSAESGLLHQSRFTLTSVTSRRTVAKQCHQKVEELDWDALLEQVSVYVLRKRREGEPLIRVGLQPARAGPVWRLKPLLLENQANVLYGAGASGKSEMAYLIGLMVQTGMGCCGMDDPIKGEVLFLDFETCWEEADDRIQALKRGMGFDEAAHLNYRFCHQPLTTDTVEIQRLVLETHAQLVIVDSVGPAMGTDSEKWDVMALRYFAALRSLRVTTLSIDHIAKEKSDAPFGSIYKYNIARNIFEVKQVPGEAENSISLGLYHRKINSGRLLKPLGFKVLFDDADKLALFERCDIKAIPELERGLPLVERIKSLLLTAGAPVLTKDLAEALGTGENTIRVVLSRHKNHFVKLQDGWAVRANE